MKRWSWIVLPLMACAFAASALAFQDDGLPDPGYAIARDVAYRDLEDEYARERCVLDVYYPEDSDGFVTIVWFHGGGLTEGQKFIPGKFRNRGYAVVAPNYRLHPKVKAPVYIQDAAAAVAWVINNIEQFGGDPTKVFVSGHSAGGYLASMVGYDKSYLAEHAIDADDLAGLSPLSGHTITHFTVRAERGIPGTRAVVDELAPLWHARGDAPPTLLTTGDRQLELLGRTEENEFFWRMLKLNGHPHAIVYELEGHNHGTMMPPALELTLKFIEDVLEKRSGGTPAGPGS